MSAASFVAWLAGAFALALAGVCIILLTGGLYDTRFTSQENSSGATDTIIVRTNRLTGEVCERYTGVGLEWFCSK